MTGSPQISFLVPVYNGEPYLAHCLDTILRQDCRNAEIVVCDDGSTDGSWELIQQYAAREPRIRALRNPANLGLQGNFNQCLRAARGEFIKYVLQDDFLAAPDAARRQAGVLESNPEVALVSSASLIVDAQSRTIALRREFKAGLTRGQDAILRCMAWASNLLGEPTLVMFRRGQSGTGFDERYRQLLDLEFCMRLLEKGQLYYFSEPLSAFRRHEAQATRRNSRNDAIERDQMLLLREFMARPWLAEVKQKHWIFGQIYGLRRNREFRASELRTQLLRRLGWPRYYLFWQFRRIGSPVRKLQRWLRLRSWMRRQGAPYA